MSRQVSPTPPPLPCGHAKIFERFVSYYIGTDRQTKHTRYVCDKCWKPTPDMVGLVSHRSTEAATERVLHNHRLKRAKAKRAGSVEGTSPINLQQLSD